MNYKGLIYIAFAAAAFAFALLNRVHMFQLNAYKYTFHKDWIKSNFASLAAKAVLPLISFGMCFIPTDWAIYAAIVPNIVFLLLNV
jgi:hypothetical protein